MKKSVCILCIICIVSLSAGALDFGDLKFEIISSGTEGGQEIYEVVDPYGNELTIVGTENLNDASLKALQIMLSTFNSWKHMTIDTQRVVVTKDRVEMALVPEEFTYNGKNLTKYMPSGMQFYYTTYLEYDFRLYTEKLFLRVSGQLFDEDQFCKMLIKAIENPVLYIQTHNPDYLIEQIGLITVGMEELAASLKAFKEEYDALSADYAALKDDYSKLESSHSGLAEENLLLRNAVIAFSNGGLFKLLEPMDEQTIETIITAKKESPDITQKDLIAALKEKGVTVSSKAVAIVFAVYFNEFE